jgi:hypothetical protein
MEEVKVEGGLTRSVLADVADGNSENIGVGDGKCNWLLAFAARHAACVRACLIGLHGDTPRDFAILLLAPLHAGQSITVTSNGWNNVNSDASNG